MYRETTERTRKAKRLRTFAAALAAVCLAAVIWLCGGMAGQTADEQAAEAVRVSVMKAAQQCCAVEGSYPDSLKHLEDNYGLRINRNDFTVTYEVFAANVMPTVTVVAK